MSTFNVVNLELIASSAISSITNATCSLDLLTYATTLSQLKTGAVFTASNLTSLPTASTSTGSLYFVESERTVYWATTATGWAPLVTGTVNELWGWGANRYGVIGDGTTISRCSPVREFCSATDWCQVSAGSRATLAVKVTGQLWAWGCNTAGQLGDGTVTTRSSPVREFCSATDWCRVSTGGSTSAAIKTSGQLWTWGCNVSGQVGDGTTINRCSPVREFCSGTDWKQINFKTGSTIALKTSGQLWSWGLNASGALGDGTTINRCSPVREFCSATDWCFISAGQSSAAAIKTNGELWVWGFNLFTQLGDGTNVSKCSPVREFCSATDWCYVSIEAVTSAIKTSGQLWTWGWGTSGQIGDGNATSRCSPVREFCSATDWCQVDASSLNTAAVKTNGQLWSWGLNSLTNSGALGDGTVINRCSPVREFCSATDWKEVKINSYQTMAIKLKTFN